jgi:hypothetical protein
MPYCIEQTADGENIVTGWSSKGVWLAKIEDQGNLGWERNLSEKTIDRGVVVKQNSDGGYLIIASESSSNIMLIKTDANGMVEEPEPPPVVETPIPEKISLKQNYPNPFNQSTEIKFDLPEAGFVKLNVYDITGKQVAELVYEFKPAGFYNVNWDARNFASGVYLYRITSGNYSKVKRMVLIR